MEGECSCFITSSCQLPSGESLLLDKVNVRLKKLDTKYKVRAALDFQGHSYLRDVCYIGQNEAVVSAYKRLTFIDVASMTITKTVETLHECRGLACHGNLLYVLAKDKVHLYSTDGRKQDVLDTDVGFNFSRFAHIAVSADGRKIYLLSPGKLTTLDNSGNRLYTFENPRLGSLNGLCVDAAGHVLVRETGSGNILKISSDGSQILGTLAVDLRSSFFFTLHFGKQRSKIIFGGESNILTVLQLTLR